MGFVIRALFVIGVLYLISPLRAALPDWLAKPSAHEKACMEAAASVLKTNEPKSSDSGDAIAALLKETPVPEKPHSVAVADAAPESPVIPLPPRRDNPPAAAAPAQKKI